MMDDTHDDLLLDGLVVNNPEEQDLSSAVRELNAWKATVEKAETEKSRLLLEKLDMEETKKEVQKETQRLMRQHTETTTEFSNTRKGLQNDIHQFEKSNRDLLEELKKCREKLQDKEAEFLTLQKKFKISAEIPETKAKFIRVEKQEGKDSGDLIKGVFTISQKPSVLLKGGQALITFEEEDVARNILKLAKCSVTCEQNTIDVRPSPLQLCSLVKFEVHLNVSTRKIQFSHAPSVLPEELMRDRLEISFSKPSQGGGEVETVDYDKSTGTGLITFLQTGVAEGLALKRKHHVDVNCSMDVHVHPVYDCQLKKFQTFCGVTTRTVLLSGVEDVTDEEELQDHLEIHFQKPSNSGGEVEYIRYLSKGNRMLAFFHEDSAKVEGD